MKRASLSSASASPKPQASDLTDRLLAREASSTPRPKRARKSPPTQAEPPASPTPAPEAAPADAIQQALAQSQTAVAALKSAAQTAPARYNVAIKFRLDALAHHLQQVSDFIAATTHSKSNSNSSP